MALVKCPECAAEISSEAVTCPQCGKSQSKPRAGCFPIVLIAMLGLALLATLGGPNSTAPVTQPPPASPQLPPTPTPQTLLRSTQLKLVSWHKVGFDNVLEVDLTVTNGNAVAVRDIEVTCLAYAKSGTRIDSNVRVIYDVVSPKSKATFKAFNMGFLHSQAHTVSCSVTHLKP